MAQKDIFFSFQVLQPTAQSTQDSSNHNVEPVQFDVVEFHLTESLNQCFKLEVDLASFDSNIDFGHLLDHSALFTIRQGGNVVRQVHGIISDFYQHDTGFRRTRYRAVVEPQLARLQLCSDWRIFQQRSAQDIVKDILKANTIQHYNIQSNLEHIAREYCVQAGLTDFDFVQRLLAEEGFVYHFEHKKDGHQLLVSDVIQSFGSLNNQNHNPSHSDSSGQNITTVIYQPNPGGDQPYPAIKTFSYSEHVRTALQTQRDYTFKNPKYAQEHSVYGRNLEHQASQYEQYNYPGGYKQDAVGSPFTQTRLLSIRNDAQIALATGDDARVQLAKAFQLQGHHKESLNTVWRAISIIHRGIQHTSVEEEAATAQTGTFYEQKAQLVPATTRWKAPIPDHPFLKGPLIGHVVCPDGEEIFTDKFGRVRVQFPWDRQHEYNEHSSCWIRVAQNWAGAGWGHMALPRHGQEVIVDFLGADESQPIIVGRAYDAQHPTPYPLPGLKAHMTIKSKEHKGSGYNEWLVDDTTGEIKTQLHSTYGATQLTMGYLTHPRAEDGNGEHRGDGFELRTDEWGAIRAAKGLYISTDGRHQAQGNQLDLQEAIENLQKALHFAQQLAESAQKSQAVPADVQDQEDQLNDVYTDLQKSGILTNAPQGIALTTPKSIQFSAINNTTLTTLKSTDISAGQDARIAAAERVSIYAAQDEASIVAGQGKIRVQANGNNIELLANKTLKVISTEDKIEIAADKEILLTSGGAYIRIKDGHINFHAPGIIEHKGSSFPFMGPASMNYNMPALESTPLCIECLKRAAQRGAAMMEVG